MSFCLYAKHKGRWRKAVVLPYIEHFQRGWVVKKGLGFLPFGAKMTNVSTFHTGEVPRVKRNLTDVLSIA
jgi:hypothetical protein